DAFVSKLNAAGSALLYSTFLGGSSEGYGIAIDASGNAYVTGLSGSSNFPTTAGAFQTTFGGGASGAFFSKLNASGSALLYSTFLGGSDTENNWYATPVSSIAVDSLGNVYLTGNTGSSNFPITQGAFQTTGKGSLDAFISKFSFGNPVTLTPLGLTFASQ